MTAIVLLGLDTWTSAGFALANHLWQSTLFAAAAALLTLMLRRNRAQTRYVLWLAASLKFLIPFALLVSIGNQLGWRSAPSPAPVVSFAIEQISQPFGPLPVAAVKASAPAASFASAPALLSAAWFLGFTSVLAVWCVRWRRIRAAVRAASPLPIRAPVEVMASPKLFEPGVFGLFRSVLLLPAGIASRLTRGQFEAILAHELCHARRRDNLAAAVHMLVEAVFWFHPLVWWIGARLVDERERACDEEVLQLGNDPQVYAEGILEVCRFYLGSPLTCAAGVTGSDLRKRIEAIMTRRVGQGLSLGKKLLLAASGTAALALPISIGAVNAPPTGAQSQTVATPSEAGLKFEVASIKPSDRDARGMTLQLMPGGGLRAVNVRLRGLIEFAYDVDRSRISGGPGWLESEGFDILAKGQGGEVRDTGGPPSREQVQEVRLRLQALLADRFQLKVHRDPKEMAVYALAVAKNGHKLRESGDGYGIRRDRGQMTGQGATLEMIAHVLTSVLGRPVLDRTRLGGKYEFKLEWTEEMLGSIGKDGPVDAALEARPADSTGPSIFSALQEQLGLKVESQKGPVDIIVIDRAERPSAN
jgi:bla regulator protein BlaR1